MAQPETPSAAHAAEMRLRLDFSDDRLLAECEFHTYRASGPGGQKRNKTSSAVRLVHVPSGVTAVGTESRSQHENKARALVRVREGLAIQFRVTPALPISWPESVQIHEGRLRVSTKNAHYHHALGLVLDVLAHCEGRAAEAADLLGVSSSSLTRFLSEHPHAWAEANRIRKQFGLAGLKA